MPLLVDGELVGAVTSWGLVTPDGDGWTRVCDEALVYQEIFWWVRPDGRIGTASDQGVFETTEGCSFTAHADAAAAGWFQAGAISAGATPSILLAASPIGDGGVVRSADGGVTFQITTFPEPASRLNRVVTDATGQVWVSGIAADTTDPVAYRSTDDGSTWEVLDTSGLAGWVVPWVAGMDTDGTSLIWGALDGSGGGALLRTAPDLSTVEVVAETDQPISHYASWGGARWVVLNQSALLRQEPGGELTSVVPNEVDAVQCVATPTGDDGLWVCISGHLGGHFLRTVDGTTWTSMLDPEMVHEQECAPDETPYLACDHGTDPVDTSDTGTSTPPPDDEKKCGCRTSGAPWGLGLGVVLFGLRRRSLR